MVFLRGDAKIGEIRVFFLLKINGGTCGKSFVKGH
jgi:hypothetical protein